MARSNGQPLPQNQEDEQAVLGAILIDSSVINEVVEILAPADFYKEAHQKIVQAMTEMYRENKPIDILTVFNYLKSQGQLLEDVGGSSYLTYLTRVVPTTVNVGYYAGLVKKAASKRKLVELGYRMVEEASKEKEPNIIIKECRLKLEIIAQDESSGDEKETEFESPLPSSEETELLKSAPDTGYIASRIDYGRLRCDAPLEYHEFGAYFELSAVRGRRLKCRFAHGTIHPNIYVLNLGPSGNRKTTATDYSCELLLKADTDMFLANDYSPEALLESLSEKPPGVFYRDEFSGFLAQLTKRDYQTGAKELLNKLFDCPPTYTRKLREKTFILNEPYLTILSGAVPDKFLGALVEDDLYSGFLARFLPILPKSKLPYKDVSPINDELIGFQNKLVLRLRAIYDALKNPCEVYFDPDGLKKYNKYCRDVEDLLESEYFADELGASYTRLRDYVIKLPMLRQVSETLPENGKLKISNLNLLRALEVIERVRLWVKEIIFKFRAGRIEREKERLLRIITKQPGITNRDLCRLTRQKSERLTEALHALRDQRKVEERTRGKTTGWYPKGVSDSHTRDSSERSEAS